MITICGAIYRQPTVQAVVLVLLKWTNVSPQQQQLDQHQQQQHHYHHTNTIVSNSNYGSVTEVFWKWLEWIE